MTSTFAKGSVLRRPAVRAVGVVTLWGCHESADQPSVIRNEPADSGVPTTDAAATPCELEFGPACGATCKVDGDCHPGLHCATGACVAECVDKSDCKQGDDCSSSGRCFTPDGIFLDPAVTDPTDPSEPP